MLTSLRYKSLLIINYLQTKFNKNLLLALNTVKKNFKLITTIILLLSLFILSGFIYPDYGGGMSLNTAARAEEEILNPQYFINLDKATIEKGYTVSAFNNSLKLSLVPEILSQATGVKIIELNEKMEMPWQLNKISQIYQFEFINKQAYDNHKPFYIQFAYSQKSNNYKQVFFYDKNYQAWRPLPTKDFPDKMFVRSLIHLPFARIAVFDYPNILTVGRASWYGYKGGNFAASPDFPKGSRLRVFNRENNKFIDVEINDFGPDRSVHPDRVIDLDKVAFAKLTTLGSGIVEVKIEPLYIVPENNKILGIAEAGTGNEPIITTKSAIVMNEQTGEILWQKNSTSTLPLASLTKLVAIKVFLDTRPSLNKIVEYKTCDEEYNYAFLDYKWELVRLRVKDGETMTIEDLIYASLVGSTNNTVETLVRVSGWSRDQFIVKMNEKVQEWGASSTYFVEPTGLSPENVSSSLDYAIITKEALAHPIIEKASKKSEYEFYTQNTNKFHSLKNTNKLISASQYNITGSKTGYLNEAGYCLMIRAKTADKTNIIVVTLGADNRDISFSETEELLKYGLRATE